MKKELTGAMAEFFKPYQDNPSLLLDNDRISCPRLLCKCSAPKCAIKESKNYAEAMAKLEARLA